jgi:hypothetical protein
MYAQKKPIDNVHIVRERDRRRSRELLAVLVLGVPIALFLLLFTWQNLEVIRLGHEATALQKQRKPRAIVLVQTPAPPPAAANPAASAPSSGASR